MAEEVNGSRYTSHPAASDMEMLGEMSAAIKADLDSPQFMLPGDIGSMIDEARMSPDATHYGPVLLLLHAAEKASGNTSSLVSAAQLLDEYVTKARNNKDAANLLMAAHYFMQTGDKVAFEMLFEESQTIIADSAATKAGPYSCDVIFNNYVDEPVYIWSDGVYLGYLDPYTWVQFQDVPLAVYYVVLQGAYYGSVDEFYLYATDPYETYTIDIGNRPAQPDNQGWNQPNTPQPPAPQPPAPQPPAPQPPAPQPPAPPQTNPQTPPPPPPPPPAG